MNRRFAVWVVMLFTLAPALEIHAQLTLPGADGSDGVFAPTQNTVVDLSEAVTGKWDSSNTANPGKGVYDAEKWAIVFKFESVNIPAGVNVYFKNHPSRAPVVWIVKTDVTITGNVLLDGQAAPADGRAEPGPGGFRGASGGDNSLRTAGAGNGIGGGGRSPHGNAGAGGSFGGVGTVSAPFPAAKPGETYGNSQILPLIGGSGGGGANQPWSNRTGGAGGGAILIAAQGQISLNGGIYARGGSAANVNSGGSGGAIRLIADEFNGGGLLIALGDSGGGPSATIGGDGRIRLEARSPRANWTTRPAAFPVPPDPTPLIWPPSEAATARIVSVADQTLPNDPRANLTTAATDVAFQSSNLITIAIETTHLTTNATVRAHIVPQYGDSYFVGAVYQNGDATKASWVARTAIPVGFATLQAHAVGP